MEVTRIGLRLGTRGPLIMAHTPQHADRRALQPVCAAAMMALNVTPCTLDRTAAIRQSTARQLLDVFLVVNANANLRNQRLPSGVVLAKQSDHNNASLNSFGGSRSGLAKVTFLLWTLRLPPRYKWVFHIEEDTVFTGPWQVLLHTNSTADLLGISRWRNWANDWAPLRRGCVYLGKPCRFHWTRAQMKRRPETQVDPSRHHDYGEYTVRTAAPAQLVPQLS